MVGVSSRRARAPLSSSACTTQRLIMVALPTIILVYVVFNWSYPTTLKKGVGNLRADTTVTESPTVTALDQVPTTPHTPCKSEEEIRAAVMATLPATQQVPQPASLFDASTWCRTNQRRLARWRQLIADLEANPHQAAQTSEKLHRLEPFEPTWSCPNVERVGIFGDGGKWMCNVDALNHLGRDCIVYSFGSENRFDFEQELFKVAPKCKIFTFDPTVRNPTPPPEVQFFKFALSNHDGPVHINNQQFEGKTLGSVMKQLGHSHVDIMKIDVEGSEWGMMKTALESGDLKATQILIELHLWDHEPRDVNFRRMIDLFKLLDQHQYRTFYKEHNHYNCGVAVEYAFIRDPSNCFDDNILKAAKQ